MAYFPACITLVALGSGSGSVSLLCLCSQLFPLKVNRFFGDTSTDTRPKAANLKQLTVMPGYYWQKKDGM